MPLAVFALRASNCLSQRSFSCWETIKSAAFSLSITLSKLFLTHWRSRQISTKHTRRTDDDKHPKGDQGEMTEFGTCDKVEALDQLRQIMAPD